MASCESVDLLQQNKLDANGTIMENQDSDSDDDVRCMFVNLDQSEDIQDTSYEPSENIDNIEPPLNTGPVLSLECLHDDSSYENIGAEPEGETDHSKNVGPEPEGETGHSKDLRPAPVIEKTFQFPIRLLPIKIITVKSSTNVVGSTISGVPANLPTRSNYNGAHNFRIQVQCSDMPRKSENAVYSEEQNKLYVVKDLPFRLLVFAENVPNGSIIRATAVFSMIEHACSVVKRCPTHTQQDFAKGSSSYEHFVQCFSEAAVYEKNPNTGALSVCIPYEKPKVGENYTAYLYKLTCFSSCTGGINRRPFMLIFTLENKEITLGRQTMYAKVCALPTRDCKMDEEKADKKKPKIETISVRKDLPSATYEKANSKYSISVKDPELYLFLKQMKCLYEASAYASKTQSVVERRTYKRIAKRPAVDGEVPLL